ncbi:MAG: NAD(P)H-binding protein [Bacteroidota bacterium]|nr:NAD(P)H-binding protein [Bacteroidota bacterium]
MKIIVTGSLGHISKTLTEILVQKGHDITVISSKAEKKKDIEALGAAAAIGSIEDVDFLTTIFTGMDAVYVMEPPFNFFDKSIDPDKYYIGLANDYKQAIQQSGVKSVIHLSSIGAHTNKGVGMLAAHYEVENILKQLPGEVSIKFMRPVGFYYNMFAYIETIKTQNAIIQNYGGDNEKEPWVSPWDIADTIAEEFEKPFEGRTVRYIASDEVAPNEVASNLGEAIGKPGLKWIEIPDGQMLNGMIAAGFNPKAAKGLVEMNAGRRSGVLYEDYNQNKPILGKVKLKDFAKAFAAVYNQG